MKILRLIRKIEKGQSVLEMIILTPYFFFFIFFTFTVAITWLGYYLNLQAANEAVSAEAAYGGGGVKARQVGSFNSQLNTSVLSINTITLPNAFGDCVVLSTKSVIWEPWKVPIIDVPPKTAIGTSMSPVWEFEPESN